MRPAAAVLVVLALGLLAPAARAQESPALAEARVRFNAGDMDGAIASAAQARRDPAFADAASVVIGRAYLERFRASADPVDLASGREALASIDAAALAPRDRVAWIVGLGQSLYLGGEPGAAAEVFQTALGQPAVSEADGRVLLDWWATSLDAAAAGLPDPGRRAALDRLTARMEAELLVSPGSAPANYWLAAAARSAGDLERAWDLAAAAWVRSRLAPETAAALRADLDRLVLEGLVPALARARGDGEAGALAADWAAFRELWP